MQKETDGLFYFTGQSFDSVEIFALTLNFLSCFFTVMLALRVCEVTVAPFSVVSDVNAAERMTPGKEKRAPRLMSTFVSCSVPEKVTELFNFAVLYL